MYLDHGRLAARHLASSDPEVGRFLDSARKAISACPGPVLVLAGADLSHVGFKFGDTDPARGAFLDRVAQEDMAALEAAATGDGEAFFSEVARINNRNHICSVTSIYVLLSLLGDG